jgi:hypothetical protein
MTTSTVTIRRATAADSGAVARLAELDSSRTPTGDILVAEVAGELWAATSVEDFHTIADPFRPSAELSVLVTERVRQLRKDSRRPTRRRRMKLRIA